MAATATWRVPAGLILLSIVPAIGGSVRLADLGGGVETPDNARFFAAPVFVILHIVTAALFAFVGAFQFVPALRRRNRWHRMAGRVLVLCGLVLAGTGIVMALFFPAPGGEELLNWIRLVVGLAIMGFLVSGFVAIRRRDIPAHRAWMIRAYALAQGAGTQVLTAGVGEAVLGQQGELGWALLISAGWVVNAIFAEWVIGRPKRIAARRRDMRQQRLATEA